MYPPLKLPSHPSRSLQSRAEAPVWCSSFPPAILHMWHVCFSATCPALSHCVRSLFSVITHFFFWGFISTVSPVKFTTQFGTTTPWSHSSFWKEITHPHYRRLRCLLTPRMCPLPAPSKALCRREENRPCWDKPFFPPLPSFDGPRRLETWEDERNLFIWGMEFVLS